MSSKTAASESRQRDPRTSRQSWSITRRLTWLYTVSASGILVLSAGFLYWALASNVAREDNQFLADEILEMRMMLQESPEDAKVLTAELQWEGAVRQFTKHYTRVLDVDGNTLFETFGMHDVMTPSLFPEPVDVAEIPRKGIKRLLSDGKAYLLMAAWAEVTQPTATRWLVQVALDVSTAEVVLADYRRKLAIVLVLGIVCSAGAGVVVAHRGMRPLAAITMAAQRITATQLHDRIVSTHWPKELMALATAFDEMLDRLEDAFTRLSQFSADLAHELRTPINNLMGEAEVALSRARTPEEYQQVLESSLEEYERLSQIIDNLLFLARAESPNTRIERSLFDARKEIDAVQEFYEMVAEEQNVHIICRGHADLYAAPMLVRRAVDNLVSNALHYTPPGGTITIAVEQEHDHSIVVSVSDTGCGIMPEHLPRLFDRFYRADPSRSSHPQGTGLGLAIVKSIMDLHGGTVQVESQSARGTTVLLRFPVAVCTTLSPLIEHGR